MTIEKLIEIISEITKISALEINESTSLVDDLGMDSFEYFKLIYELENEIEDVLVNNKLDNVTTVSDVYDMIKQRSVE